MSNKRIVGVAHVGTKPSPPTEPHTMVFNFHNFANLTEKITLLPQFFATGIIGNSSCIQTEQGMRTLDLYLCTCSAGRC
jgi:hypothetical protein